MKNLYLLICCLIPLAIQAQVRITAENSPQIGNRLVYKINTAASGLSPGAPGQGQVWDFTNFVQLGQETINIVPPDNIPGRDSFPDANLVFSPGNGVNFSFALNTDSAFFSLGSYINTGDSATALFNILEPPRKEISYPTEFGSAFEILVRTQRNLGEIAPGTFLISVEEERIQSKADAEGLMQLPQGEFSVLRIKQNRSRVDSTFFSTAAGRQFISANSTQTVTYEWYTEAARGPLVTLDESSFNTNSSVVSVLDLENSQLDDSTGIMIDPPVAAFDTLPINQSTYFFLNQSSNQPDSWFWDFGDGTTATAPSLQHQFSVGGSYEVCLEVRNSAGADTTCKTIVIERLRPLAGFSFSKGAAGKVSFTNLTQGESSNFIWDFGDGNSSLETAPEHQYTEEGTFTVCLTANNAFGSDSTCQQLLIDNILPTAQFNIQKDGAGLYTFTNQSSSNTDSLHWDFGDGNSSLEDSPTHQYTAEGNYTVCLIVFNTLGSDTLCQILSVSDLLPVAAFGFEEPDFGLFAFTDESQNTPQSWQWQFGDGSSSNAQNPTHQYSADGNYTVQLIVENSFGADTTQQMLMVSGLQTSAGFDIDSIGQGEFRFFNLSSANSTRFTWDFGDGGTAMEESPIHQYTQEGFYTVCLVAANSFTSDTLCTTLEVEHLIPEAGFVISAVEGDSIQLMDTSNHLPTEWLWTFGDGDSSRIQNPGHRYELAGTYEVCLLAKNRFGQDSTCQMVEMIFVGTQSEWMRAFIELAPNPFQDQLRLNWTPPGINRQWQYRILEATGSTIQKGRLEPSQTWDTSRWSAGTYWLQILDQERASQLTIPIIKQ